MTDNKDYFPTMRELQLIRKYEVTDEACIDLILHKRYGSLKNCLKCGRPSKIYKIGDYRARYGFSCHHQFSPLTGTIFEKSRVPLPIWFEAIYQIYVSEGKVPARELARQLGYVRGKFYSYKTPYRIKQQIVDYLGIDLPKYGGFSYQYSSATNGRYSQADYRKKHNLIV
jgi:transposase-like protein